jgi:hypothetical protein
MTSESIREILGARTFESFVKAETIKAKIESGEITDVKYGCGDDYNGIYAVFDTYEEALEANREDVKNGAESAVEMYTIALDEAQSDYEEHGHIDTERYGIEPHEWIFDAIESGKIDAEDIAAQAQEDSEEFHWIALVNDDPDGDDKSPICMIY